MKKKLFVSLAIMSMVIVPVFALTLPANASADAMLWGGYATNVRNQSGLGDNDPRGLVGSVIKILLGFLGIIAVLLILYGGFKWMTAAGNDDAISEAKKIIGAGVVGLVIILMAFAIAQFVITALYNATGATG